MYIGRQPIIGNFVKLDAITTSATTTFNLLNGGVAYYPQSANNCLVSLNGILQAPTDSYTISGSTIIFSNALTTSDVIDFIIVLGDVLNIGTPSDNTVSLAKLTATGTKDATTFLRGDNTFQAISSDYVLLASTEASSSASVSFDGYFSSTYKTYQVIVNNMIGSTNNQEHYIRLRTSNADITTSTYKFIVHTGMRNSSADSTLLGGGWNASFIRMAQNSTSSTASRGGANAMLYIANPLNTASQKMIYGQSCAYNEGESEWYSSNFSGNNSTTSALSGITFYMQSGNIASGNFKLYGIK